MSNDDNDNPKQRAFVLLRENRVPEAAAALKSATEQFPNDAEAWCVLGAVEGMRGAHERAVDACRKAIAIYPEYPEAWCNLGASQHDLRRYDEAVANLTEALRLRPDYAGALFNLGNSLKELHRFTDAADAYRRTIALQPDVAELHLHLGIVLTLSKQHAEAVAAYEQALRLNENLIDAHANLGASLTALWRIGPALCHLRRATALNPRLAEAWNNFGNALLRAGDLSGTRDAYRRALQTAPNLLAAQHNLLYSGNFDPDIAPDDLAEEHRRWGRACCARIAPLASPSRSDAARRLRIGYVIPDPGSRTIAHTLEPVLAAHDAAAVEIFCYVNAATDSPAAARMRRHASRWQPIGRHTDAEVAARVARDGIDVLVDVGGHAEYNRLEVFACKPAPVQISWLGYPNTTGLPTMDYYIADAAFLPLGEMEHLYVERILRLPTWICYQPPEDAPDVTPSPALRNGHITFGSLNTLAKTNSSVIALWSNILHAVPDARLLMQAQALADDEVKKKLIEQFRQHGIPNERIETAGPLNPIDHLRLHDRIDIALDPFPWSGWATTCHTLWMGVPVVTMDSRFPASRSGVALLSAIDRKDLIATDADDYRRIAATLAPDVKQLDAARREQRQRVATSALCDTTGFTRALERAYRAAWDDWRATSR